jgi:hypothetical protein
MIHPSGQRGRDPLTYGFRAISGMARRQAGADGCRSLRCAAVISPDCWRVLLGFGTRHTLAGQLFTLVASKKRLRRLLDSSRPGAGGDRQAISRSRVRYMSGASMLWPPDRAQGRWRSVSFWNQRSLGNVAAFVPAYCKNAAKSNVNPNVGQVDMRGAPVKSKRLQKLDEWQGQQGSNL